MFSCTKQPKEFWFQVLDNKVCHHITKDQREHWKCPQRRAISLSPINGTFVEEAEAKGMCKALFSRDSSLESIPRIGSQTKSARAEDRLDTEDTQREFTRLCETLNLFMYSTGLGLLILFFTR